MITLSAVSEKEKTILWNYLQKYLFELSGIYGLTMGEDGNFPYPYFEPYFTEPARRAFFFKDGDIVVGFAMINDYSATARPADHAVAEFSVFPAYRKNRIAVQAMELLLEKYHGRWQIKYSGNNPPAKKLWTMIGSRFGAHPIKLDGHEEVIEFCQ